MQNAETDEGAPFNLEEFNILLTKVYGWTFLGLMLTSATAYITEKYFSGLLKTFNFNPETLIGIVFFELAFVWIAKAFINRFPVIVSYFVMGIYAVLNGFIFTAVFNFFNMKHVHEIFALISVMFIIPAVFGYIFKANLAMAGGFLLLALSGIGSAVALNIIQHAETSEWIISMTAVVIFLVIALIHRMRIKQLCDGSLSYTPDGSKPPILSALFLYLDFIVLFIIIERFIKDGD